MTTAAEMVGGGAPPPAGNPPAPAPAGNPPPPAGNPPPPPAGGAWAPTTAAPIVDLLKSKGMYEGDFVQNAHKLAESYWNANKALSGAADVLPLPSEWNDDNVNKFYSKIRPATPGDYADPKFAEGVDVHKPLVDFAKKLAHHWGVPASRLQSGIDMWQAFAGEEGKTFAAGQQKANSDAIEAMRTKVGAEVFNGHVANGQRVVKALAASGAISADTIKRVEMHIGGAAVIELLSAIGSKMGEAPVIGMGNGGAPVDPSQMTPEQASQEITKLQGDAEFLKKYNDAKHPEHGAAVERMKLLFEAKVKPAQR